MDNKLLNPLTLAYMGDAVLDQHVREYIVLKLKAKPNRLHQEAKRYVSAKSQAQTLEQLTEADWFY
ncbi:cysteinyl-tRNA synthetase [Staphylococcus gallinarum]|uniref:Cysteinyl-tRNA synthetase n=1 Tax=Staphylococcus gallinarum TaxID=1293 RepID=A0A380FBG5_STAGA|nr:cysteinyl-tRNA synthetase [Staphylococcus gallinarum]